MKKAIIASLLAVSGLAAMPTMAAAVVDVDTFRFECPNASGGVPSERLTNYGTYCRGMGELNNGSIKVRPIFHGVSGAGIPLDLSTGSYSHAGAQYNPSTGRITCLFTSSAGFSPFSVSYEGTNIQHGYVVKADNTKITIRVVQA